MNWMDIAAIVFICTAVNHLELIATIERVIKRSLPVINCPKCFTCWSVMAYCCLCSNGIAAAIEEAPRSLAISLLCSYLAIWLELLMYAIDTLYNRLYGILENNNKERHEEGRPEEG
jgi:hypothetical protein